MSFSADHILHPYIAYECNIHYYWDSGALFMPVAAEPAASGGASQTLIGTGSGIGDRPAGQIVQVQAPCGKKIVTFAAKRSGVPPAVPSPDPNDGNQFLKKAEIMTVPPKLQADGVTQTHEVSGYYEYICLKPIFATDSLRTGGTPYDAYSAISFSNFIAGLQ